MLAQLIGYLASIAMLVGAGILSVMLLLSPGKTDGVQAGKQVVAQKNIRPAKPKMADEIDQPHASQLLGKRTATAPVPEAAPPPSPEPHPALAAAKKKSPAAKSASAKARTVARSQLGGSTDVLGYAPAGQGNTGPFYFRR